MPGDFKFEHIDDNQVPSELQDEFKVDSEVEQSNHELDSIL